MTTAPVSSQPVPVSPSPRRGVTETAHARAHFTPASKELLPEAVLGARIGRGTLAGALNDQVRFRIDRTGTADQWKLLPDSPAALAVVQSEAGPALLRQLEMGMRTTQGFEDRSVLKGFMLPKDNEGVLAGRIFGAHELDPDFRRTIADTVATEPERLGSVLRAYGEGLRSSIASAGAWNSGGWITYMPDMARAVLTGANAYDPSNERADDASITSYLARIHPHEVQHSITPRTASVLDEARWIEEGTADVLSNKPAFRTANQRAAGLTVRQYERALEAPAAVDLGWKAYERPVLPKAEGEAVKKMQSRRYGGGEKTLSGLLGLAGVDFRTTVGKQRAADLLQRQTMSRTPGVLAKAIIAEHGLEPKVYDRLRERIKVAVDLPDGVRGIAREFGIS
ncbi:MAG: hypothetical protein JWM25_1948 [Thermoleophilia bacterium]|nr:hypothetical protein [Thermoleophilia bacterium]